MQSAAGMTKEERLFITARSDMLLCVKRCIETYHTRKNYEANVHFIHTEQKTHMLLQIKMQAICHLF